MSPYTTPSASNVSFACLNGRSDLDSRPELDHAIGGDVEVIGDVASIARHGGEDAVAPVSHRHDLLPGYEERGFHRLELEAERAAQLERAHHVEPVHEAVAHAHAPAVVAELLAHHALLERHPRHVAELHRQEHQALVH